MTFQEKLDYLGLKILGKDLILGSQDLLFMLNYDNPQYKEHFKKQLGEIETRIRNLLIGGCALSISLSLSLVRYFPNKFAQFSIDRVLSDLSLALFGVSIAFYSAVTTSQPTRKIIKLHLANQYDPKFLEYLIFNQDRFKTNTQYQMSSIMNQRQYSQWLKGLQLRLALP